MKNIFLLGSTGSIGVSTLDVVAQHPEKFTIRVLATFRNLNLLNEQIDCHQPDFAIIFDKKAFDKFTKHHNKASTQILFADEGVKTALESNCCDTFVNAFVGFAGLKPTVSAIEAGLSIALANKETLVAAGELIMDMIAKHQVALFPIDSEHSAIWQCIVGENNNTIKRIILTASGGPFREKTAEELKYVTTRDALQHPNWKMGSKITIDSATLMNKGLEVIEAFWLYGVKTDQIQVVIHPQSIVHSLVEFVDNSIKAQLGIPDMRIPIQYALSYPERLPLNVPQMDFEQFSLLNFENPDTSRFPCLRLAYESLRQGQSYPVVLNAANEIAVDAFLENQIKFIQIPEIISEVLNRHQPSALANDIDLIFAVDRKARESAEELIRSNYMS